jgi:hypothetical protein
MNIGSVNELQLGDALDELRLVVSESVIDWIV